MSTATAKGGSVPFTLPPLPYPSEALEPHIDKLTMEIHHDKHHGAYVNNLNKALESAPQLAGKSLIQRWLLGSVSKRVISYAPCSVLIVR